MNHPTMRQIMQVLAILDIDEMIGPLPHLFVRQTVETALYKLYAEFECAAIKHSMMKTVEKTPEEKLEHTMKVFNSIHHSADFKYLGNSNDFGWVAPEEYQKCFNLGHFHDGTVQSERSTEDWVGNIHTCPKCKIYWKHTKL